jgi:hypothetical protein
MRAPQLDVKIRLGRGRVAHGPCDSNEQVEPPPCLASPRWGRPTARTPPTARRSVEGAGDAGSWGAVRYLPAIPLCRAAPQGVGAPAFPFDVSGKSPLLQLPLMGFQFQFHAV